MQKNGLFYHIFFFEIFEFETMVTNYTSRVITIIHCFFVLIITYYYHCFITSLLLNRIYFCIIFTEIKYERTCIFATGKWALVQMNFIIKNKIIYLMQKTELFYLFYFLKYLSLATN
jgi:hypothetical protein